MAFAGAATKSVNVFADSHAKNLCSNNVVMVLSIAVVHAALQGKIVQY